MRPSRRETQWLRRAGRGALERVPHPVTMNRTKLKEKIHKKRLFRARLRIQQGRGKVKDFALIASHEGREAREREQAERYAHLDAIVREE